MAASSSSLDPGVNSVAAYDSGQMFEFRVNLEISARVLESEAPMLGSANIDYLVNGR